MANFDVNFNIVKADGGKTAAERFAEATFTKDSKTFYIVGADLYLGSAKLTSDTDLQTLTTRLDGGEDVTGSIKNVIRSYMKADEVEYKAAAGSDPAVSVEGALDDLYTKVTNTGAAGAVTIEASTTDTSVAKTYSVYQGVLASDDATTKAAKKIADIQIPLDMVVESGEVKVATAQDVTDAIYTGVTAGDKYIELTIANATNDKLYIPVKDLVDVYTAAASAAEVQVAISATNEISATIVKVNATKVIYREEDTANSITEQTVKAKIDAIDDYIGEIPSTATATNVVAYVDEKTGSGVGALNADVATGATGDNAVVPTADATTQRAVISELTQANGKITAAKKVTLEDVAVTGKAEDVSIDTTDLGTGVTDVEAALQTIVNRLSWTEV